VADFVLSKNFGDEKMMTSCGSPGYVAPEVLAGARATAQSDLYSLGVLLEDCLRPWSPPEAGRLVAALYSAMQDAGWGRLKLCRSSDCRWAFYDQSKNHSSRWCTMASCGNREKARRFRSQRKTQFPA